MKELGLDPKQYKYLKSDDRTTTLQHKKGHTVTIAHDVLSPKNKAMLQALSKIPQQDATQSQKAESDSPYGKTVIKEAKGGRIPQKSPGNMISSDQCYPDGGIVDTIQQAIAPDFYEAQKKQDSDKKGYTVTVPKDSTAGPTQARPNYDDGGAVTPQWDQYKGAPLITDAASAPLFYKHTNEDSTSPAQDQQRRRDMDASDAAYRQANPAPTESNEDAGYDTFQRQGQAQGGKICKACGGPVRKMAHGGKSGRDDNYQILPDESEDSEDKKNADITREVEDSDNFAKAYTTPNPNYQPPELPKAPESQAQVVNPAVDKTRKLYNQAIATNPGMSIEDQQAAKMGKNGEAPQQINQNAIQSAQQQLRNEEVDKVYAQQDAQAQAQAKNQGLQALGLPPTEQGASLPDTVPPGQQPNDGLGQQQPQAKNQPNELDQYGTDLYGGYKQQQKGIEQEAKAKEDLGTQQYDVYDKNIQAQQDAQSEYQRSFNDLSKERQNFISDIQNNHINPDQYWEHHSKLLTAIGLIIAGFNPAGTPDTAINLLQHRMDQNLQAQVANLGAKKTLLEGNLRQFGNIRDATDMTRLMQASIVQNSLMQAAAKASSPLARAAASQASGQLQMQYAPLQQQFAMRQAMMRMANGGASPEAINHMLGYMRIAVPEQAKEMEQRYVPEVGLANVQVPDGIRQKIVAQKDVQQTLNQALQFAQQHAGSLDPRVRAQGQTLMNELQSKIRTAEDQGVYKESEANFMRQTLGSSPASFLANWNTVPRLKEIQQLKMNDYNNMLKTYGLPQQQQQEAPQFQTRGGVKYQKVPGGWKKAQ